MLSLIIFLALASGFIALLFVESPGKPEVFKNDSGELLTNSISEKIFIEIGGVQQGMFILSMDTANPVLLFLHGGPCFPNYFLFEKYKPGLEQFFTVYYWEQRGGGLSYNKKVTAESMSLEQLVSDAIEVTNYLRNRFCKEKIYIMAWSGGTTIALPAVAENPGLFHAYLAMGQITNQVASERIAYAYINNQLRAQNNYLAIRRLNKFNQLASEADLQAFYNAALRDKLMHKLGIGTMREMKSVYGGIFVPVMTCKAYTLAEKFNIWKAKLFFLPGTGLKNQTLNTNFAARYPKLEIPVFFFCGLHDLTVNSALTEAYFGQLEAPIKKLYIFENSAHGPLFEEPQRLKENIVNDIFHGSRNQKIDC